jgi:hypothetical protein
LSDRRFLFFRCPDGTVAFDVVISGGTIYRLDSIGMCPLCGAPVAEHESFTLSARAPDVGDERDAA